MAPDSSKRPRRRWSHRMGSLEVMVKSMLDLRQLETFAHKKNSPSHDRERQSTSSLQEPMVCMDLCLRETKRDPCMCNHTANSHMLNFCCCSWRREPRGIGPGHMLTGCPHKHPRASGSLMELCCTLRRTRTIQVYGAGRSPLSTQGFTMKLEKNKGAFLFLV